jgi:hypothetical protein
MFVGIGLSGSKGGDKPFSPAIVSGLQLWLDAEYGVLDGSGAPVTTDGGRVATWQDKSGRNAHAVQADISKQPILKTLANGRNGRPVLEFTAAQAISMVTGNVSIRGVTAFCVFSSLSANNQIYMIGKIAAPTVGGVSYARIANDGQGPRYQGVFQKNTAQSYRSWSPSFGVAGGAPYQGWDVHVYRNDGTPKKPGIAGATAWEGALLYSRGRLIAQRDEINAGPGVAQILVPATLGAINGGSGSFDGYLAELIVYDSAISQADHQAVENYIASKWDIPMLR